VWWPPGTKKRLSLRLVQAGSAVWTIRQLALRLWVVDDGGEDRTAGLLADLDASDTPAHRDPAQPRGGRRQIPGALQPPFSTAFRGRLVLVLDADAGLQAICSSGWWPMPKPALVGGSVAARRGLNTEAQPAHPGARPWGNGSRRWIQEGRLLAGGIAELRGNASCSAVTLLAACGGFNEENRYR